MSDEPLRAADDTTVSEVESLRAELHERVVQLENAVRLGEQMIEERDHLQRQLDDADERDAQRGTVHRKEMTSLHEQLNEAIADRETLATRFHDLEAELKDSSATAESYRQQLASLQATNAALRSDEDQRRRREEDRAAADDTVDSTAKEELNELKLRISELSQELATAKANAKSVRDAREADRQVTDVEMGSLRDKVTSLQADLDRTRRDAAAERARLQSELQDAQFRAGQSPTGGDGRRSVGPNAAPSVPALHLEDGSAVDQSYNAFTTRARNRAESSARFNLASMAQPSDDHARRSSATPAPQPLEPSPGRDDVGAMPAPRTTRRRLAADSDSDNEVEMSQSQPLAPAAAYGSTEQSSQQPAARTRSATYGRCPTCGRSDSAPAAQQHPPPARRNEQNKGCPCVVM